MLTAIAIPVFTTQLERSREATDIANIRAVYAEAMTEYIATNATQAASGSIKQKDASWHIDHNLTTRIDGAESTISVGNVTVDGTFTVTVSQSSSGATNPTVAVTFS